MIICLHAQSRGAENTQSELRRAQKRERGGVYTPLRGVGRIMWGETDGQLCFLQF